MITIARHPDWSADVVVDADPATSLRDVVKNLLDSLQVPAAPAGDPAVAAIYVADRELDLSQPLAASGIHDGTVLWLDRPGPAADRPSGLVTVRAVAGTQAGQVWYLDAGEHRIGSGADCAVTVSGDQPAVVAVVRVSLDAAVHVRAVVASALLGREPLPEHDVAWRETVQLAVGDMVLEAHPLLRPDAMVEPSPDGEYLDYNRPPRLLPPARRTDFQIPAEPKPPGPNPMPWLMAALPAVTGAVIALAYRNPLFLLMTAMSPIMVIGSWLSGRRQGRVRPPAAGRRPQGPGGGRRSGDRGGDGRGAAGPPRRQSRRGGAAGHRHRTTGPAVGTPPYRPGPPAGPGGRRRPAHRDRRRGR